MDAWIKWADKAEKIRKKYAHNEKIIHNELHKLRPKLMGRYDSGESLVVLFLLWKSVAAQKQLYERMMHGTKHFLDLCTKDKLDKEVIYELEQARNKARELQKQFSKEYDKLATLSREFNDIDGKVKLKDVESGAFFQHIDEKALKKITNTLIRKIEEHEEHTVKRVHSQVLNIEKEERKELEELKRVAKNAVDVTKDYLIKEQVKGNLQHTASAIYLATFIAHFIGVNDENLLYHLRVGARTAMK